MSLLEKGQTTCTILNTNFIANEISYVQLLQAMRPLQEEHPKRPRTKMPFKNSRKTRFLKLLGMDEAFFTSTTAF